MTRFEFSIDDLVADPVATLRQRQAAEIAEQRQTQDGEKLAAFDPAVEEQIIDAILEGRLTEGQDRGPRHRPPEGR